jgi:hypothetical protein
MGWVVSVTPRPRFTPRKRTSGTHWRGGWVGLRAGLVTEVRGKILCLCRGSNLRRPICSQTLHWPSQRLHVRNVGQTDWRTDDWLTPWRRVRLENNNNTDWAGQDIFRVMWDPKVYCRVHKSPPPVPVLSQMNLVHTPNPTSIISTLILSSNLRQGVPSGESSYIYFHCLARRVVGVTVAARVGEFTYRRGQHR